MLQTALGWFIEGRNKGLSNQFSANKMSINPHTNTIVHRFWFLKSGNITDIESKLIMTKEKHKAVKRLMCLTVIIQLVYYRKTTMLACQTVVHQQYHDFCHWRIN